MRDTEKWQNSGYPPFSFLIGIMAVLAHHRNLSLVLSNSEIKGLSLLLIYYLHPSAQMAS